MKTLAAVHKASPDLYLLGVPETSHNKPPSAGLFPDNLNAGLKKHWDKMFKDQAFLAALSACSTNDERWAMATRSFLSIARANNASPFQPHMLETDNGKISAALAAHRNHIHKEMVRARLSELAYRSATPIVSRRKGGFALCVNCKASAKGHDFSDIAKMARHLSKNGFQQAKAGVYEKPINPESVIRVDTRRKGLVVSYEILSSRHPFIQSWAVVTKAKYNNFVVSRIWKPLVKSSPNTFSRFGL